MRAPDAFPDSDEHTPLIDLAAADRAMGEDVALISVMTATGALMPLAKLAELAHGRRHRRTTRPLTHFQRWGSISTASPAPPLSSRLPS